MLDLCLLEGGAIAVLDGKIVAVGPEENVRSRYAAQDIFDAGDRVVCPGFVDPHTHIVFGGDRLDEFEMKLRGTEYLEILARGGGILSTVEKTRQASIEQLVIFSENRLAKMLASGTTSVEIKTGYGLDLQSELKMLRAIEELQRQTPLTIVPTFLAAHAVPPEFSSDPEGYVNSVIDEMLPAAWEWYTASLFLGRTPFFVDVFAEKNAFTVEQMSRIFDAAASLGFRLKAHVDEFTNLGGSRAAIDQGATSIDHLDAISDEEIDLLASSGTVGIVTPTVNFNFGGCHFADARRLIDNGCAVAVSTDYNPGSAPCPSQQMAMAIACRYQKLLPAEAFNAATINAAYACGLGETAGSLEPGKWADILVLDARDYREIAHEFGSNHVAQVFKKGKLISPAAC